MGNSVGSRYRYGASFVDRTSGVRFEGHHPVERPDLWKVYLNEAEGRYRNFGTEDALRRQILDGARKIPVRLHFVGRLVVIVLRIVIALLFAVARRLSDVIGTGVGIESRHSLFRELEVIRAIEGAFARIGITHHRTIMRLQDGGRRVIQG